MSENKSQSQVEDVRPPHVTRGAERRAERIAELMKERSWHFDEIESAQQTIHNHYRNIRDIEDQIDALKKEAD